MKTIPFSAVKLGGFWGRRLEINRTATIPTVYDRFTDTGRFEAFRFNWKEGSDLPKPHFFWDSDIAKWIEAAAYSLALHPDKEEIALEALLEIDRDQSCLPVMAVDQLGLEAENGKGGKHRLGEIRVALDLPVRIVRVYGGAVEVILIVDEIILHAVLLDNEKSDIHFLPVVIHVERSEIIHPVLDLLLHAGVPRKDNPDIVILRIKFLRQ